MTLDERQAFESAAQMVGLASSALARMAPELLEAELNRVRSHLGGGSRRDLARVLDGGDPPPGWSWVEGEAGVRWAELFEHAGDEARAAELDRVMEGES